MRYPEFLRQRYRAVLSYTGLVSLVTSLIILSPLLLLLAYPAEWPLAWPFLGLGLSLALLGGVLWFLFKPQAAVSLNLQEGSIIVVLAWLLAILFGAGPFTMVGNLTVTQAVFEATSGWTTTGLSVVDVTQASPLILFYRSAMQLAGGAGLAIITLSALAGPLGPGLSSAEGRGEQLLPHVRRSVKLVLTMYSGYVLLGWLALYLAGMDWFDALNHAFAALSTGGFSTRPESIGYWDNPVIEAVVIVLMLVGTTNFLTAYTLLQGNFNAALRNGEVRLSTVLIALSITVLLSGVVGGLYPTLEKTMRVAVFEVVTALSTTGFSTVGYSNWNSLGWLVLIILMLVGGGTGSTAGGLKQYRVYVLYRGLSEEIRSMLLPRTAVSRSGIWQGEQQQFLEDRHLRQVGLFVFLYLATFWIGTGVIAAHGYSLSESLFEFASAQGTVGLSIGVTAADAPVGVLWVEIAGMWLGRLEFLTIIVGLSRIFSDIPAMLPLKSKSVGRKNSYERS